MDYDSDYEPSGDKGNGASTADPYAGMFPAVINNWSFMQLWHIGVFFSKDRREEVIEVEEEAEVAKVLDVNESAKLMTQGQWMKGCPEGGEQGFLFSQYHELIGGECICPHGCGTKVPRQKQDFFALFVSTIATLTSGLLMARSRTSPLISLTSRESPLEDVGAAQSCSVSHAENQCQKQIRAKKNASFIALTCKVLSSVSD